MSRTVITTLAWALTCAGHVRADEAAALERLERAAATPRISKDKQGRVVEIALNAPDLRNEDLALFNEFAHLEKLTISHAGYANGRKTGVDFSGVAQLKDHPSLKHFSAGGAIGKEYLAALPALTNVPELFIQTTHSVDADWAPIGKMKHLTYLGIRVRNDRMSQLTDRFFEHLTPLDNLEAFLVSEMIFKDPAPFVKFVTSRPKLRQLTIRRCNLSEEAIAEIRQMKPQLEIAVQE